MPQTDSTRAGRGTIALFVAAAVLAVFGVSLLLAGRGAEGPTVSGSAMTTPSSSAGATDHNPGPASLPAASPAAGQSSPQPAPSKPTLVPAPIQEAARAFAIAWASHDARPGGDASYDDASRRAAARASDALAEDLRSRTTGSAGRTQWEDWKKRQVLVTVTVLRVSLPDGAPAPTKEVGFARVVYKVTEKPAKRPAVDTEQHVALKLRRGIDGTWRVVGLPHA